MQLTSGFNSEGVGSVLDSLLEPWSVGAAAAWIAAAFHVDEERRARNWHAVVGELDGVFALLERRVADLESAVRLRRDQVVQLGARRVGDGTRHVAVVVLVDGARVHHKVRRRVHVHTCERKKHRDTAFSSMRKNTRRSSTG